MRYRPAIAALVLGLALSCAGDDGGSTDPTATPVETAEATPTPADEGTTIDIEVRDGAVVGGAKRVEIERHDDVVLTVRSDVSDEVHVHGYDETADVEAGGEVTIEFTADIPGVFIAELEQSKLELVTLVVR